MRNLLRLEELAQFLLCLVALIMNSVPWWAYLLLFIGPDVGMMGYLVNPRVGAFTYNLLHHKGIAVLLLIAGMAVEMGNMLTNVQSVYITAALVIYGHASMDRILGYGLKFGDNFHHTHLGWIGKLSKLQGQ